MEITKEIQAAIDVAVDEATADFSKDKADLSRENAKWRRLAQGKDAIDPAEIEKLETQIETLKTDNAALTKANKTALKDADTAKAALATESGFTSSLLIDQGLTSELTAAGVTLPHNLKAATAMLRAAGVQVVVDGDKRVAKVGDKALGKFVTEWTATDEGKHFVTAKQNSGGNAPGGNTNSEPGKTMTRAAFNVLSPLEQSTFSRAGGSLTDA